MEFNSALEVRELEGKFRQLIHPFIAYSEVLKEKGYENKIEVPEGFICDYESVPVIEGSSKRAGVIHDYLYRIDSTPCVPKEVADKVYLEAMCSRKISFWRRWVKYLAVSMFAGSYYHKRRVFATLEEIKRKEIKHEVKTYTNSNSNR